jgi:hypothetical protein
MAPHTEIAKSLRRSRFMRCLRLQMPFDVDALRQDADDIGRAVRFAMEHGGTY